MKLLVDILPNIKPIAVLGDKNIGVGAIAFDSRKVCANCLFVALQGSQADGHQYIIKAIHGGATVIVYDKHDVDTSNQMVTWIKVNNSAVALGHLASNFYDRPSSRLKVIGITGTNGKTTCATLLFQALKAIGYKVGLFSTVCNYIQDKQIPSTHTTPDALQINQLMYDMLHKHDCEWVIMEVSSHALTQYRISGIQFYGGIFTNITRDHLDFHKDFNDYIYAKKKLFDALDASAFALVNKDSKQHDIMVQNTQAKVYQYGIQRIGDFNAQIMSNTMEGLELKIDEYNVWFRLLGRFNAYNILTVYGCMRILDIEEKQALQTLSQLEGVKGRFEIYINPQKTLGIVDYGHTPDALENALSTIHDIQNEAHVITVFGCGGNRDKSKRPVMTKIALDYSDKVIITWDNPRDEEPQAIISDMMEGLDQDQKRKILIIENRKEAIKTAAMLANPKDIILIAGKGHESYQEIRGEKLPFNDMEHLKEYL